MSAAGWTVVAVLAALLLAAQVWVVVDRWLSERAPEDERALLRRQR